MNPCDEVSTVRSALPAEASREQRFLLDLLKKPTVAVGQRLHADVREVSWTKVFELVTFSLHPYLDHALHHYELTSQLPPEVAALLHAARKDAVLRYLRRKHEMTAVLQLLDTHGIETVVLKGFALAHTVYPVPDARYMQDVDLLVKPEQLELAFTLLQQQGFVAKQDPRLRLQSPDTDIYGADRSVAKVSASDILMIELHTHLPLISATARKEHDELWSRTAKLPNGSGVRVLHPHDELITLCMHLGFQHGFERCLLWLLDIRLWLEKWGADVDREVFASTCKRREVESYVYLTLSVVHDWLGAEAAGAALKWLHPPAAAAEMKALIWEQMWHSKLDIAPPKFLFQAARQGAGRGLWAFVRERSTKWRTGYDPLHHTPETGPKFVWLRFWGDVRKATTAFRLGAFGRDNLKHAAMIADRRERLESLLQSPPGR